MLLGTLAAATNIGKYDIEFMNYVATYQKNYATIEEFEFRLARWIETEEFIQENNDPKNNNTHTAGHNHLSDWTREEYRRLLGLSNTTKPE